MNDGMNDGRLCAKAAKKARIEEEKKNPKKKAWGGLGGDGPESQKTLPTVLFVPRCYVRVCVKQHFLFYFCVCVRGGKFKESI